MRLRKAWEITTSHGDTLTVMNNDFGAIQWAKRHGYQFKRVMLLSE